MAKIIILAGGSSTGKSTTLSSDFYNWLMNNQINKPNIKQQINNDLEGIFYHKKGTIAVFSWGDEYYKIVFAIVRYIHCNYIVLAGNTKKPSISNLVAEIGANGNNCVITKLAKTNTDNQRACNDIIAAI
jgi:hypothetical protein